MLLLAVSASASVAEGQKAEGQKAAGKKDAYLAAVRDAIGEFDAGNYAEARVLFAQAHSLKPNARTLRGMGMTSFELKEYVRAEQELNASLVDLRQPLAEAQRKEVLALLLRLERYIGKLEVRVKPENATVTLDGARVIGVFKVELGRHELRVHAPGYQTTNRTVNVEGGRSQIVEVSLIAGDAVGGVANASAAAPEAPAPEAAVLPAVPPKDTNPYVVEHDTVFEQWWFWGIVTVAVAGGVTAAVLLSSRERAEPALRGNTGPAISILTWSQH